MRIQEITACHARIPLKTRVRHASCSRSENDSLLICCRLEDGTSGWGEGLPRPYVTGETIDSAWQHVKEFHFSSLGESVDSPAELVQLADRIQFRRPADVRDCYGNSVRCAVELAILDAFCRSFEMPLGEIVSHLPEAAPIRHRSETVTYSAAITAAHLLKVRLRAWLFRGYGFRQCKVKVGLPDVDDLQLMKIIRSIFGPEVQLRIDANEAWLPDQVASRLERLAPCVIAAAEQPVPHDLVESLRDVRARVRIPIMLDESLCSLGDALRAIEHRLCDAFNIRLSKCGGFLPSVRLARTAHDAGLFYQLGCQVGETGILSAAGRHFATSIGGLFAVEGSFDRHLVRERLTVEDLTFGRRGEAPRLHGVGAGITIDPRAVERVAVRRERFTVR